MTIREMKTPTKPTTHAEADGHLAKDWLQWSDSKWDEVRARCALRYIDYLERSVRAFKPTTIATSSGVTKHDVSLDLTVPSNKHRPTTGASEEAENICREIAASSEIKNYLKFNSEYTATKMAAWRGFQAGYRASTRAEWPSEEVKIAAREMAKQHAKKTYEATVGKNHGRYHNKIQSYFKGFIEGVEWLKSRLGAK